MRKTDIVILTRLKCSYRTLSFYHKSSITDKSDAT